MESLILNVQKYSIHDGDGIRTTIFFKGCPLECKWCHNPESQSYQAEMLYNKEKCTACGRCVSKCPQNGIQEVDGRFPIPRDICTACASCVDYCFNSARERAGKTYSQEDLLKEIEKDKMFYEESGGGVTLSGGEVMTQNMQDLMAILKACDKQGYRVNIDTCGYADFERFERVLPYVDTFLYDLKQMDDKKHIELTGKSNQIILDNLRKLSDKGAKIHIRIPLIEGLNTVDQDILAMAEFIQDLTISDLTLLPYHAIGKSKYDRIDVAYEGQDYAPPTEERLAEIQEIFAQYKIQAKLNN